MKKVINCSRLSMNRTKQTQSDVEAHERVWIVILAARALKRGFGEDIAIVEKINLFFCLHELATEQLPEVTVLECSL